ncbi:hypothetical protein ASF82_04625 [Frigoribacterium sp. Leaf164]|uniref:FHA domain-containing protein n=1 Tax=Frigoribacterium sp. Leaf164 TaxID=1736282 RepID=UPI0006FAD9B3|nr:FHA domain-containing protein [Frigoribacterium sp. Leaf164]KQR46716.1 hypothetical protein ASF82_04625 [Frigoribacterium sp. Leaf164]
MDHDDPHRDDDTVVTPLVRPPGRAVPRDLDDTVVRPRGARPGGDRAGTAPVRPARRRHGVRVGTAVHWLDRPLLVGRRPAAPRVVRGAEPQLVTVPSAGGEVSASHVSFDQQGDVVVVTDLRSTNGTVVVMPGRVPVRLRQGESVVALAGTIVDLGDGVLLEVLPPQRIPLQEDPLP